MSTNANREWLGEPRRSPRPASGRGAGGEGFCAASKSLTNHSVSSLNREAMVAHSCGRKPADSSAHLALSRECGGSMEGGCRRIRGSKISFAQSPWADAHGYALPSLRDSQTSVSNRIDFTSTSTPHPQPLSPKRGEGSETLVTPALALTAPVLAPIISALTIPASTLRLSASSAVRRTLPSSSSLTPQACRE